MKSQACSGSGESPVMGTVPSQCPALLSETCLRPGCLVPRRALPRPSVNPVWVGPPRGEGALVPPFSCFSQTLSGLGDKVGPWPC